MLSAVFCLTHTSAGSQIETWCCKDRNTRQWTLTSCPLLVLVSFWPLVAKVVICTIRAIESGRMKPGHLKCWNIVLSWNIHVVYASWLSKSNVYLYHILKSLNPKNILLAQLKKHFLVFTISYGLPLLLRWMLYNIVDHVHCSYAESVLDMSAQFSQDYCKSGATSGGYIYLVLEYGTVKYWWQQQQQTQNCHNKIRHTQHWHKCHSFFFSSSRNRKLNSVNIFWCLRGGFWRSLYLFQGDRSPPSSSIIWTVTIMILHM